MLPINNITLTGLQKTIEALNYKWFEDQLNLISIRTKEQVPDVFNDYLCLAWKQASMPNGLTPIQIQEWLNTNKFYGRDNKPLKPDGNIGPNTNYALSQYNETLGKFRLKIYIITTEPGVYYQKNLLNKEGCWVMMPAQMINAYKLGYHQNKPDHRALRSVGKIYGLREDDRDGIILDDPNSICRWENGPEIGANIHGANHDIVTLKVGPWSAGCQVHEDWNCKEEMCNIAKLFENVNNGLITYTLLNEDDYSKNA